MFKLKYIICAVVLIISATTVNAQTYNDDVRAKTWSIYLQGGLSSYHDARGDIFKGSEQLISPQIGIGIKYNLKPWVRFGFNADFSTIKSVDKNIQIVKTVTPNFQVGSHFTDLEVEARRIQNKNDIYLIGRDINVDFNIAQLWSNRKTQWFNIYAGVGIGWANFKSFNTVTWAYKEQAVAKGSSYNNIYMNNRIETKKNNSSVMAIYYPFYLSFEFDLTRQFTAGVIGQYKMFPYSSDNTPKGFYSGGIVLRYNFVKSTAKIKSEEIVYLKDMIEQIKSDCAKEIESLNKKADEEIADLKNQIAEKDKEIADAKSKFKPWDRNGALIYFDNNSTELNDEYINMLKSISKYLATDKNRKVVIFASANTLGSEYSNQKLSDRRLDTVKHFLLDNGVNADQFKFEVSLGEYKMDESDECRRVLVVVQ